MLEAPKPSEGRPHHRKRRGVRRPRASRAAVRAQAAASAAATSAAGAVPASAGGEAPASDGGVSGPRGIAALALARTRKSVPADEGPSFSLGLHRNFHQFVCNTTPSFRRGEAKAACEGAACDEQGFRLADLWAYYDEPYGHEVPLALDQASGVSKPSWAFFVPYLSGLRLYARREASEEPPRLLLEWFETTRPDQRVPLVNKVRELAQTQPLLLAGRSSDLDPRLSWFAVSWYPIMCDLHTSAALSGCLLTYHRFAMAPGCPLAFSQFHAASPAAGAAAGAAATAATAAAAAAAPKAAAPGGGVVGAGAGSPSGAGVSGAAAVSASCSPTLAPAPAPARSPRSRSLSVGDSSPGPASVAAVAAAAVVAAVVAARADKEAEADGDESSSSSSSRSSIAGAALPCRDAKSCDAEAAKAAASAAAPSAVSTPAAVAAAPSGGVAPASATACNSSTSSSCETTPRGPGGDARAEATCACCAQLATHRFLSFAGSVGYKLKPQTWYQEVRLLPAQQPAHALFFDLHGSVKQLLRAPSEAAHPDYAHMTKNP